MTKFLELWDNLASWSQDTLGDDKTRGPEDPLKLLMLKAQEAIDNPNDVFEFADCLLLVMDASRRAGFTPDALVDAAQYKLTHVLKTRTWDKTADLTDAVQHVSSDSKESYGPVEMKGPGVDARKSEDGCTEPRLRSLDERVFALIDAHTVPKLSEKQCTDLYNNVMVVYDDWLNSVHDSEVWPASSKLTDKFEYWRSQTLCGITDYYVALINLRDMANVGMNEFCERTPTPTSERTEPHRRSLDERVFALIDEQVVSKLSKSRSIDLYNYVMGIYDDWVDAVYPGNDSQGYPASGNLTGKFEYWRSKTLSGITDYYAALMDLRDAAKAGMND